jgi:predicted ATPase with chaperone activity
MLPVQSVLLSWREQGAAFLVVGLPNTAVQESRERVRAAIKNSGLNFS